MKDTLAVGGANVIGTLVPAFNPTGAVAYKVAPQGKKRKAATYAHTLGGVISAPIAIFLGYKLLKNKPKNVKLIKHLWKNRKAIGKAGIYGGVGDAAGAMVGYNLAVK